MKFELTPEQEEKVRKFHPRCKRRLRDTGAIGGGETFIFEPNGLDTCATYRCVCGKELPLTDVSKW
jgi:hypothetical protein